jgi:hypothetical protein
MTDFSCLFPASLRVLESSSSFQKIGGVVGYVFHEERMPEGPQVLLRCHFRK